MDLSRQLDPLEERISLLDTALQSTSDSSNIAKLDQVITLTIEQLAEQVKEAAALRSRLPQVAAHAVAAPRGRQCGHQRGICRT